MVIIPFPADWDRADYDQPNCPHCGRFGARSSGPYSHWVLRCGHDPESITA